MACGVHPKGEGTTRLRRTRRRCDCVNGARCYHGPMGCGKVAELFDVPKTTIRDTVARASGDDLDVTFAVLRCGLARLRLAGL